MMTQISSMAQEACARCYRVLARSRSRDPTRRDLGSVVRRRAPCERALLPIIFGTSEMLPIKAVRLERTFW